MNKEIEKLLFNPIRLKTISFLMTVETCTFKMAKLVRGYARGLSFEADFLIGTARFLRINFHVSFSITQY